MRKTIYSSLLACFVFIGIGVLYAHPVKCPRVERSAEAKQELQSDVIATLETMVGKKETHGANWSPEIKEILASVGINYPAFYCAAYVSYGYTVNNICNPNTAWSPSLFPAERCLNLKTSIPQPADAFGVYNSALKRIAHAGAVKKWPREGDYFISLEGNTNNNGSRNGDGFYEKRRPKRSVNKVSRWI